MLAYGRFQTETPNVIDPGEETPSRPARAEIDYEMRDGLVTVGDERDPSRSQWSQSGAGDACRSSNSRHQKSNKGTISKGVRIHYMLDADDELGTDDDAGDYIDTYPSPTGVDGTLWTIATSPHDPEFDMSRPSGASYMSSPASTDQSIEQARLFAAAMLNESDRRRDGNLRQQESRLQKIVRSANMTYSGGGHGSYYSSFNLRSGGGDKNYGNNKEEEILVLEDSVVYSHYPKRWRRQCLWRTLACVMVVAMVTAFSVIAVQSSRSRAAGDDSSIDSVPASGQADSDMVAGMSARLEATIEFLFGRDISTAHELYNSSSAQFEAARWIADVDLEQLTVPAAEGDADPYNFVQRYVLAVLYFSWKRDEQWIHPLNFTSGIHECAWYQTVTDSEGEKFAMGVGCDKNLQVRSLLLPSNNLKGSIPDEIQHLSKLEVLNLKRNALTGTFPMSLKRLTRLAYLDLNFNKLTGSIPNWLGDSLGTLKVLGLGHNSFHGTIPESLGSRGLSTNLKTLSLENNLLIGVASAIQRLRNLEYLYINNNDLSGRLDTGLLSDMPYLKEADLSHNKFSKSIPNHLLLMHKLRVLNLGNNDFSGSLPSGQESQQNDVLPPSSMEFFSLRNNSMSSSIPESLLEHWPSLTHLDLSMNNLTGEYPTALGDMIDLKYLSLGENSFHAGAVPEIFQSLTNLQELSLDNLQMKGTIPSWLHDLGQLRLLDMSHNLLNGSISLDFNKLANLEVLMLNDNLLTGSLPRSIVALENLTVLSLHHNNVSGDVEDVVCAGKSTPELVAVDCGEIACPCCESCCDSDNCFQDVLWDVLEQNDGNLENEFQRDDYAFNPKLIFAGNQ